MNNNPLFNLNIERAVLSAIIFDPQIFEEIAVKLQAHDFHLPFHKHLFTAIGELNNKNYPIDEVFLAKELGRDYDEVSLLNVMASNPISNIDTYVDEIKEMSKKRKLETLAIFTKKDLLKDDKSSEDVIRNISKVIESIDRENDPFEEIGSIVDEFELDLASAHDKYKEKVLATGIKELDQIIGGVEEGEVIIIGARPSMGKTAAITTMMANWIKEDPNCGILFDSLEMEKKQIVRRLVSTLSDSTLYDLKKGLIKDFDKYKRSIETIKKSGLIIHDKNGVNFNYLRNKAKRVLRKNPNIRVWIIDHVGEIAYKDPAFLRIEIGEVMSGVRAIAKEFGISVMILSQLNREVASRKSNRPTLADLRESGELEQKADKVILLHRESYYQRGEQVREPSITEAEMIVAKNRDGATGVAKLKFEGRCTRFISNDEPFQIIYEDDKPLDSVPQAQQANTLFPESKNKTIEQIKYDLPTI